MLMQKKSKVKGVRWDKTKGQFVSTWTELGEKRRKFFDTMKEAEEHRRGVDRHARKHGEDAFEYSREEHVAVKSAKAVLPSGVSIPEAVEFYMRHAKIQKDSPLVETAVAQYLSETTVDNFSTRHVDSVQQRLGKFLERWQGLNLSDVLPQDIASWLDGGPDGPYVTKKQLSLDEQRQRKRELKKAAYGRKVGRVVNVERRESTYVQVLKPKKKTVLNWRADIGTFLNWAASKGFYEKGWEWPYSRVKMNSRDLVFERGILRLEEVERLFRSLVEKPETKKYVAYFALSFFAGVREAELRRFQWRWLDFRDKAIRWPKEECKGGEPWTTTGLPSNVFEILKKHEAVCKSDGGFIHCPASIVASRMRRRWEAAGIIDKWPQNCGRHSFCTYHISLGQPNPNPASTAFLLRHEGTSVMLEHYLKRLELKETAVRYFSIVV